MSYHKISKSIELADGKNANDLYFVDVLKNRGHFKARIVNVGDYATDGKITPIEIVVLKKQSNSDQVVEDISTYLSSDSCSLVSQGVIGFIRRYLIKDSNKSDVIFIRGRYRMPVKTFSLSGAKNCLEGLKEDLKNRTYSNNGSSKKNASSSKPSKKYARNGKPIEIISLEEGCGKADYEYDFFVLRFKCGGRLYHIDFCSGKYTECDLPMPQRLSDYISVKVDGECISSGSDYKYPPQYLNPGGSYMINEWLSSNAFPEFGKIYEMARSSGKLVDSNENRRH